MPAFASLPYYPSGASEARAQAAGLTNMVDFFVDVLEQRMQAADTWAQRTSLANEIPTSAWAGTAGDSVRALSADFDALLVRFANPLNAAVRDLRSGQSVLADLAALLASLEERYGDLHARYLNETYEATDPEVAARIAASLVAEIDTVVAKARGVAHEVREAARTLVTSMTEATERMRNRRKDALTLTGRIRGTREDSSPLPVLDRPARRQARALAKVANRGDFAAMSGLLAGAGLRDLMAATPSNQTLVQSGQGLPVTMSMVKGYQRLLREWGTLTPAQRTDALGDILNGALAELGLPPVLVEFGNVGPGAGAYFSPARSAVRFSRESVSQATLSPASASWLFGALVHEGTHAIEFARLDQQNAPSAIGSMTQTFHLEFAGLNPQRSPWQEDPSVSRLAAAQEAQTTRAADLAAMGGAFPAATTPEAYLIYECSPLEWEAYRENAAAQTLYEFLTSDRVPDLIALQAAAPPLECTAKPILPSEW